MFDGFIEGFSAFVLYYYMLIYFFYGLLITLSVPAVFHRSRELQGEDFKKLIRSDSLPTVAVVMPMHDEDPQMVIDNINSVLDLEYPSVEVILVNDGSTTDLLERLLTAFNCKKTSNISAESVPSAPIRGVYASQLYSNLCVVDKENGGKADSHNAGVNVTTAPLILIIDSDTIIEKDALLRMIRPFYSREGVVAEGGTLRVLNGCTLEHGRLKKLDLPSNLFAGVQVVEYLRAFLYGRLGWNSLGGNLLISGAFGLLNRDAIVKAGGYDAKAIGEDLDMTLNITRDQRDHGVSHVIEFIPDPVCWTSVPSTRKTLSRQRERWHMGLLQALIKYRRMIFNPKYGVTGLLGLPYFLFGELLAPVVEACGFVVFAIGIFKGILSFRLLLFFFIIPWSLSCILTTIAIILENAAFRRYQKFSHFVKMLFFSIFENIGYRQLYVYWRLKGFWRYFRGQTSWK